MTEWWEDQGYLRGKSIGNGLWIVLAKMIFTHRLMICTEDSVHEFYCYPDAIAYRAYEAFSAWDGNGDPLDGWVKHHPSHRRVDA